MQVDIPQILWHDEQNKIMSIDFYPNSLKYFVTSSYNSEGDSGIRFWELKMPINDKSPNFKIEPQY